jgi:hypothetical protein
VRHRGWQFFENFLHPALGWPRVDVRAATEYGIAGARGIPLLGRLRPAVGDPKLSVPRCPLIGKPQCRRAIVSGSIDILARYMGKIGAEGTYVREWERFSDK